MAQPPFPRDPNLPYEQQPQQWTGPMPLPPPQPQVVYVQAPPPPVPGRRGMSLAGHGFNWTLTFVTCGMWLVVYACWWATVRSWQMWRNWRNRRRYNRVYG